MIGFFCSEPLQNRQPQIRKGDSSMLLFRTNNMPLMLEPTTGKEHWKIPVAMNRPITHTAAKDN
jgi:hypothetical protein